MSGEREAVKSGTDVKYKLDSFMNAGTEEELIRKEITHRHPFLETRIELVQRDGENTGPRAFKLDFSNEAYREDVFIIRRVLERVMKIENKSSGADNESDVRPPPLKFLP
jgi:hypothetical protein